MYLCVYTHVFVCVRVSALGLLAMGQGRPWLGQYLREVLINIVVLNIIMGIMVKLIILNVILRYKRRTP